jgi:hypothetical protein
MIIVLDSGALHLKSCSLSPDYKYFATLWLHFVSIQAKEIKVQRTEIFVGKYDSMKQGAAHRNL